MEKEVYSIYYFDYHIGTFTIDENNHQSYKAHHEEIEKIENKDMILYSLLSNNEEEPIYFILSRIENMKKFNLDELQYSSSNYKIKRIK